ncbi:MAG: efflux RND transporter periplasmic adaptor subunit [Pirellula sp.]|nr:efflux RND transporter periplasmic adaptor subunit [Pirellula sp.]
MIERMKFQQRLFLRWQRGAWLAASLVILGCGKHGSDSKHSEMGAKGAGIPAGAMTERPSTPVDTIFAISARVTDYREFTGRTAPAHAVDVRPRVSGYLLQTPNQLSGSKLPVQQGAHRSPVASEQNRVPVSHVQPFIVEVREGERVEVGTPLFEIDPRPYKLALEQSRGNRIALEAQIERLRSELSRLQKLKPTNSISDTDLELAQANLHESEGQYQTLLAMERRAELDLEFTQIKAPIAGVLGRSLVNAENVVSADSTLLTTLVSIAPIHVYFDIDEASFLQYRSLVRAGKLPDASEGAIPVSLALTKSETFPYKGFVNFQNNTTDLGTGNTLIRAEFANEDGSLSPGLYGKVRVPFSAPYEAVLVPTKCLAMDQQGKYLMVVGDDNVVHRREVLVGTSHGPYSVIREGLQSGEQVIYEGLQKIRPNDRVQAIPSKTAPSFGIQ